MNDQSRFCFTNTDQILFPHKKITKKTLLDYYEKIGPVLLSYIAHKPIILHRFVKGIDHQGTFDLMTDTIPSWFCKKKIGLKNGQYHEYLLLNSIEQLLYIVDQHCITPYIFLHNSNNLYHPDYMIFVLEKNSNVKFNLIRWAAEKLKNFLESYQIKPFGMIGPNQSITVLVPLKAKDSFKQIRICAFNMSKKIAKEYPQHLTIDPTEVTRDNRIFINTEYNRIHTTIPAPYSVFPEQHAPIAMPFFWGDIHQLKPEKYTIFTVEQRLNDVGDPWKEMKNHQQSLFNFSW